MPDFRIALGKSAAGQSDCEIGVRPKQMTKTKFGVHVNRRDGGAKSQIRSSEIRLVVIIETVGGDWPATFQWLIVASLKQPPSFRIDLRVHLVNRNQDPQHYDPGEIPTTKS